MFGSGSDQQQVVSMMAVVGRTVVEKEDNNERGRLFLFGNSVPVDTFYDFLGYRPLSRNDDIVPGSFMQV